MDPEVGCGSAWKKDPAEGVIGVQTGPRRRGVPECSRDHGSRVQDAGRGDDREDTSRVLRTRQGHQGEGYGRIWGMRWEAAYPR